MHERANYTMVPNFLDEIHLDVYSARLMLHLLRVAGANGGRIHQSTTTLARVCDMSRSTIVRAKQRLEAQGLIIIRTFKHPDALAWHEMQISPDIWEQNAEHFSGAQRPGHPDRAPAQSGPDNPDPVVASAGIQGIPDPATLTTKEIAALQLEKDEDWEQLLQLEQQGKNRMTAVRAIKKALTHPPAAVEVYRQVAEYWPKKGLWGVIESTVGDAADDLAFWEQVVQHYILCGWNPQNISGMLDHYKRRTLPTGHKAGGNDRGNGAAERAWAALELAQTNGGKPDPLALRALARAGKDWHGFRRMTEKEAPFVRQRFCAVYEEMRR